MRLRYHHFLRAAPLAASHRKPLLDADASPNVDVRKAAYGMSGRGVNICVWGGSGSDRHTPSMAFVQAPPFLEARSTSLLHRRDVIRFQVAARGASRKEALRGFLRGGIGMTRCLETRLHLVDLHFTAMSCGRSRHGELSTWVIFLAASSQLSAWRH